jgi:hypothetical protein
MDLRITQRFQTARIQEVDDSPPIRFNSQPLGGVDDDPSCDVPMGSCNLHVSYLFISGPAEGRGPWTIADATK